MTAGSLESNDFHIAPISSERPPLTNIRQHDNPGQLFIKSLPHLVLTIAVSHL